MFMIRLGLAVAPSTASPLAFVVFRDRLEVCLKKASDLGYDGIELALLSPDEIPDIKQFKDQLSKFRLSLPAISTGRMFAEGKLFFTNQDATQRRKAIDHFKMIIALASEFGSMVNIGRVRGGALNEQSTEQAEALFVSAMQECADYAAGLGVQLLLEPVNRYEINYLNSVKDGLAVLNKIQRSNVKLMPDVFHMNIEDVSIEGGLKEAGSRVGYVHFADSNRMAPGQGHLNFQSIVRSLKDFNYDGFITLEILPVPDPDTAAKLGIEYLRKHILNV
jgi:5-keto-L-gluconate epimerase